MGTRTKETTGTASTRDIAHHNDRMAIAGASTHTQSIHEESQRMQDPLRGTMRTLDMRSDRLGEPSIGTTPFQKTSEQQWNYRSVDSRKSILTLVNSPIHRPSSASKPCIDTWRTKRTTVAFQCDPYMKLNEDSQSIQKVPSINYIRRY